MLTIEIPGEPAITLEHLILDLNGTLTDRGTLIDGAAERLAALSQQVEIHLATADTFGVADEIAGRLGLPVRHVDCDADKERLVADLGAGKVAAIGNGRNDVGMLRAARLGIAVIGPEGAAAQALLAADVVCADIRAALGLLLDSRALRATLRA